ncbi:RING/U-box superfamily protein [Abeliophyllum distichum]|uniref:RING-type E3 ubiquitin transferase n=1 Tax=Abeliophyllum distichum TaxID=126358 RepID=A0ABD1UIZ2_9LAMI
MGGCCCCCASKTAELNPSPPFYLYPRVSEEREPLSSHHETVSALSTGLVVDTNLDTSARPHTPSRDRQSSGNKSEPAVETTNAESADETNSGSTLDTKVKNSDSDEKAQLNTGLTVSQEIENEDDLKKSSEPPVSSLQNEEDVCPICLEEYDAENPKLITKCDHHFHLACILEWMERSDTCPVCDQETVFSPPIDV